MRCVWCAGTVRAPQSACHGGPSPAPE